jgi:hypothetical protein
MSAVGLKAEIDDQSFNNKERFQFLPEKKIGFSDSFNVMIKFIPPKGKKVNKASFVKIWEKKQGTWLVSESLEIENSKDEFADNILLHNVLLKAKNSSVAIEVDFIHCSFSGGQCDQERYLGKINRKKQTTTTPLEYKLKI